MLPAFESAYCVYGPVLKAAAKSCGVDRRHFGRWSKGLTRVPKHKRQSVDRALGSSVDWEQYDREVDALTDKRPETPKKAAPESKGDGWGATPTKQPTPPKMAPVAAEDDYYGV